MTESQRIVNEYDRVMHGDAWHGYPIWQILDGISAEYAAARPLAGAHTIWEIVMHMTFWEGVAAQRLSGQRAGLVEELNFPAQPEATEANWQKTLRRISAIQREISRGAGENGCRKLGRIVSRRQVVVL